jgi:putative transcription factor
MQRERLARKWTQKQLAQQIHEKPQVVHLYESAQAIPNGAITQKLNKALGGKLPAARRRK